MDTLTGLLKPGQRSFSLLGDVFAGTLLGVCSIPQFLSYASLSGIPPLLGITTAAPSLLLFSLFSSSFDIQIGVTSLTAMMAKSDLGGADAAPEGLQYSTLLASYTVATGVATAAL
jgi:MFS superfamily sulfate permease-like transporter